MSVFVYILTGCVIRIVQIKVYIKKVFYNVMYNNKIMDNVYNEKV